MSASLIKIAVDLTKEILEVTQIVKKTFNNSHDQFTT